MKKKLLILAVLFVSITCVNAQSKSDGGIVWGAGINFGLPTGNNFTYYNSFGIGLKFQGEKMFTDQVSGIASIGYTNFFGKSLDNGNGGTSKYSLGLIPILVGARYYASENFFLGAQIGYGNASYSGGGGSSGGFDYLPQVGYNTDMYQIVLGYNGLSVSGGTINHVDLSFVYKFGGGK
jgi:hypothetical protein